MTEDYLYPSQIPAIRQDTARDLEHLTGRVRAAGHWSNPARVQAEGLRIEELSRSARALLIEAEQHALAAPQAVGQDLAIARARGLLPEE